MNEIIESGTKRDSEYKVGLGKPPLETRFSSTNQPANPGRKKGKVSMTAILTKLLDKKLKYTDPFTKKSQKKSIAEIINVKLLAMAIQGDISAIKEVNDRIDGKLRGIDGNFVGDTNIQINIKNGNSFIRQDQQEIINARNPNK